MVLALTFPGIGGITFDATGDVFVSYDNTTNSSGQRQSVAEVDVTVTGQTVSQQRLVNANVFTTSGGSAFPGTMTTVGPSDSLPSITGTNDDSAPILELQPNGQLFVFNPENGNGSQYDDIANYTPNASNVYNAQTATSVNLTGQISLASATFGDFGVYQNSLVIAGESNNWDFVMRVTYGSSGGVATILAASPITLGHSTTPEGVAVDSLGTVLTTLPYVAPGSDTATDIPVGFSLTYDSGGTPTPVVPELGLTAVPDIAAGAIAVDSQNNFIIAATNSSLYGGGPGIVHVNSALTAFLADPTAYSQEMPSAIACQTVSGTSELVFADANFNQFVDPAADTFTFAGELPLFSGQVSAAQLRQAYGINQISFKGPGGTTVAGDGTGQTIAIVEEGVDPTLAADLATFDQFFGIPAPPNFAIIDQNNVTTENNAIVGEASLDVEWAHAVAPGASIIVYNAAYDPTNGTTTSRICSPPCSRHQSCRAFRSSRSVMAFPNRLSPRPGSPRNRSTLASPRPASRSWPPRAIPEFLELAATRLSLITRQPRPTSFPSAVPRSYSTLPATIPAPALPAKSPGAKRSVTASKAAAAAA